MDGSSSSNKSADAFLAVILAEHRDALVRFILFMRVQRQDMEDVLQEVLHAAVLARHRFDPASGALRPWLIGIAANHITHYLDRAHRRREQLCPIDQLDVADEHVETSEALLIAGGRTDLLHALLAEIPVERRSVLVAHDLLHLSMAEIAAALDLNLATVWSRQRVALLELKAAAARWQATRRARGEDDEAALPPLLPRPALRQVLVAAALVVLLGTIRPNDGSLAIPLLSARLPAAIEGAPAPWPPRPLADVAVEPPADAALPATPAELPPMIDPSMNRPPIAAAANATRDDRPAPASQRIEPSQRMAEAKLIARAAAALGANQANEAHRLLEQHARAFPEGSLAARRNVLLRTVGDLHDRSR